MYQTEKFGWVVTRLVYIKMSSVQRDSVRESHDVTVFLFISFFNNVIGIADPSLLSPPDFCPDEDTKADSEEEPVDFLSLLLKKH